VSDSNRFRRVLLVSVIGSAIILAALFLDSWLDLSCDDGLVVLCPPLFLAWWLPVGSVAVGVACRVAWGASGNERMGWLALAVGLLVVSLAFGAFVSLTAMDSFTAGLGWYAAAISWLSFEVLGAAGYAGWTIVLALWHRR
jgi:hypothetical protein